MRAGPGLRRVCAYMPEELARWLQEEALHRTYARDWPGACSVTDLVNIAVEYYQESLIQEARPD